MISTIMLLGIMAKTMQELLSFWPSFGVYENFFPSVVSCCISVLGWRGQPGSSCESPGGRRACQHQWSSPERLQTRGNLPGERLPQDPQPRGEKVGNLSSTDPLPSASAAVTSALRSHRKRSPWLHFQHTRVTGVELEDCFLSTGLTLKVQYNLELFSFIIKMKICGVVVELI